MAEQKAPGVVKSIEYDGETFEVPFAKGNPGKSREELDEIKRELRESGESSDGEMVATMGFCAPYQPRTYLTELPGVICERDQACVLRDGMIIYADIYRPAATAEKVLDITKKTVSEQGLTCMMVTHNMQSAIDLGDRLIMMNKGRIIFDASGDEKKKLTVPALMELFRNAAGESLATDRILLGE